MGHQLTAPQPNFGPNKESTEDIIALDSDGEEMDLPTTKAHKAMLPPQKYTLECYKKNPQHGRPKLKHIRSRGATAADTGVPARVGVAAMTPEDRTRRLLYDDELDFDSI